MMKALAISPSATLSIYILCSLLCSLASPLAHGAAKSEFARHREKLEQEEAKQQKALTALYQINQRLKKISVKKSSVKSNLIDLEAQIKTTEKKIKSIEESVTAKKQKLAKRLKALSRVSGSQLVGFFMSSDSALEADKNFFLVSRIAEKDQESVAEYRDLLREHKNEILKLTRRQEKFETTHLSLTNEEGNFEKEHDLKTSLVESLKKSRLFSLKRIADLRKKNVEMNIDDMGLLDSLTGPSFFDKKGELAWPLAGEVIQTFGLDMDLQSGIQKRNNGIIISDKKTSEVRAVFQGQVGFVGKIEGFGPTLILEHGDHFYTVYSLNEQVLVKENDLIKSGQVIAMARLNPQQNQRELYFEVRHFSEAQDPLEWMKGNQP